MSYDLFVFEPADVPQRRTEFDRWYRQQTDWSDAIDYNDPKNLTPALRAWFDDIIKLFPPMNGPLAVDDPEDESCLTDYSLAPSCIYAAFAHSQAKKAHDQASMLAARHKLGFLDIADDQVWLPTPRGWTRIGD